MISGPDSAARHNEQAWETRARPRISLAGGMVLHFHLIDQSLCHSFTPSAVIAEEDIEAVEEGVFDVHL